MFYYSNGPENAVLYSTGGWEADTTKDSSPYIEVDLQREVDVTAVVTRGHGRMDQYVESYSVWYSNTGIGWTTSSEVCIVPSCNSYVIFL